MTGYTHLPVLADALVEALSPVPHGRYLDGTLGLGGHARLILTAARGSALCGIDQDAEALAIARERLAEFGDRVHYFHLPFADFPSALAELGWDKLNGALLDLGVSSPQLDRGERGFSLLEDGRLDMRMNRDSGKKSAWHMVNQADFNTLRECLATLGEEPMAGGIARRIVEERQKRPINSTLELAELVCRAYPAQWRGKSRRHPATRTFQAIRMAVNDELGQLRGFLNQIMPWLAPGARLCVITFHSLEDRLVKHAMRHWARGCVCPPASPVCECGKEPQARILTKKPLVADEAELAANPRARSAKLRVVEKMAEQGHDNQE